MKFQAVRGFKDWLPEEFIRYYYLIEVARKHLRRANFKEIKLPILEKTELFVRSIGRLPILFKRKPIVFRIGIRNG